MRHRAFWIATTAITLGLSPVFLTSAAGAPQASKAQGSSQTHDLSGVWFTQGKVRANFAFEGAAPFLPWGEERVKAGPQKEALVVLCIPPRVPGVWTEPYRFEI